MWVDANGAHAPLRYFDVTQELERAAEAPEEWSPQALRDALLDTLQHHLVADVPVGAFLSAGLDSATIVALTAELQPDALRSVTLAFEEFDDTEFDEAALAEKIAAHYDTAHRTQRVKGTDFHAEYHRLCTAMDQPSIDGVNTYFVSKVTAETGLKVAMSGLGGDELFGGYLVSRRSHGWSARLGKSPVCAAPGGHSAKLRDPRSAPSNRRNMPGSSNTAALIRTRICYAVPCICRGNCRN